MADLDELVKGTILNSGEFTIVDVQDSNNFGITYSVKDADGNDFTLKEFFPSDICIRQGTEVLPRASDNTEEFTDLKNGFAKAVDSLVAIENPNIAKITKHFSENGTCYMVTKTVNGTSLEKFVKSKKTELRPEQTYEMLIKLIRALYEIHAAELLHRDIEPKNIIIQDNLEPFLFLGFATFHDLPGKETRAVSKIMSAANHYAAMELRMAPDAHTPAIDIYSLAASFYFAISGEPPVASIKRVSQIAMGDEDPYVPLKGRFDGFRTGVLETLDMGLSVFREGRINSASEWLQHLSIDIPKGEVTKLKSLHRPTRKTRRIFNIPIHSFKLIMILGSFGIILLLLTLFITGAR